MCLVSPAECVNFVTFWETFAKSKKILKFKNAETSEVSKRPDTYVAVGNQAIWSITQFSGQ